MPALFYVDHQQIANVIKQIANIDTMCHLVLLKGVGVDGSRRSMLKGEFPMEMGIRSQYDESDTNIPNIKILCKKIFFQRQIVDA